MAIFSRHASHPSVRTSVAKAGRSIFLDRMNRRRRRASQTFSGRRPISSRSSRGHRVAKAVSGRPLRSNLVLSQARDPAASVVNVHVSSSVTFGCHVERAVRPASRRQLRVRHLNFNPRHQRSRPMALAANITHPWAIVWPMWPIVLQPAEIPWVIVITQRPTPLRLSCHLFSTA